MTTPPLFPAPVRSTRVPFHGDASIYREKPLIAYRATSARSVSKRAPGSRATPRRDPKRPSSSRDANLSRILRENRWTAPRSICPVNYRERLVGTRSNAFQLSSSILYPRAKPRFRPSPVLLPAPRRPRSLHPVYNGVEAASESRPLLPLLFSARPTSQPASSSLPENGKCLLGGENRRSFSLDDSRRSALLTKDRAHALESATRAKGFVETRKRSETRSERERAVE